MIFAETDRLFLRMLEHHELPRMRDMLNVWDVVRWLSVVPFPYTMQDAEEFYADMAESYAGNAPQFFALALKSDNLFIGAVGLHPPRTSDSPPGELEIGYWLARDFWGRGLISEAVREVIQMGFARPGTHSIGATTATNNFASQNVLRKAGLRDLGVTPRTYAALRGDDIVKRWLLTRAAYEQRKEAV